VWGARRSSSGSRSRRRTRSRFRRTPSSRAPEPTWREGRCPAPLAVREDAHVLTLEELAVDVESGAIDTVVCAFTDMQGRLLGKREEAHYFLEETAGHGLEGCNYLLALDLEMDPQPGNAMASWERGYGDFHLLPDLATLRKIPWLDGTALVLCDVAWEDGSPVVASPRQVLAAQVARRPGWSRWSAPSSSSTS